MLADEMIHVRVFYDQWGTQRGWSTEDDRLIEHLRRLTAAPEGKSFETYGVGDYHYVVIGLPRLVDNPPAET